MPGQPGHEHLASCTTDIKVCQHQCAKVFDNRLQSHTKIEMNKADGAADGIARHYGMGSISFIESLRLMTAQGAPGGGPHSACDIVTAIFNDNVHPNDQMGRILLSDLLVYYLNEVFQQQRNLRLSNAADSNSIQANARTDTSPIHPWNMDSLLVPKTRCFLQEEGILTSSSGSRLGLV